MSNEPNELARYRLSEWPFREVPEPTRCNFLAGRPDLSETLESHLATSHEGRDESANIADNVSGSDFSMQRTLRVETAQTLHFAWALSMRETTSLEIKLKLYHVLGLGYGCQQLMAEAPRRPQPALVSTALLRYNMILTARSGQWAGVHQQSYGLVVPANRHPTYDSSSPENRSRMCSWRASTESFGMRV